MEGDCNVYAHSSLWMCPTRPDRYNAKMVYRTLFTSVTLKWPYKSFLAILKFDLEMTMNDLQNDF